MVEFENQPSFSNLCYKINGDIYCSKFFNSIDFLSFLKTYNLR